MIGYTTKGEKFIFDHQFYPIISQCTWSIGSHGYLQGALDGKMCLMHRIITNCPSNKQVDHINHNKLDNRLCNLRVGSASHNQMNEQLSINNTSGCTGVSFNRQRQKWQAYLHLHKKKLSLGYYNQLSDAINARKEAEEKYFGDWSYKSKGD